MTHKPKYIRAILLFIPLLTVIWSLYLNHLSGPHYISRTDPEYVYLLNGMNAATLHFDRIGHVDHPGTPFQLVTGLFIAITYWVTGSGNLVTDLISNPEKYLYLASFFLTLLTAVIIYRLSALEYRRSRSLAGALIIPLSLFFYYVVVDLPSRYIPDRFQMIILLFYSTLMIQYLFLGFSRKKFILLSGLTMALGVMTKINFLPFLVFPLFFITGWKDRALYLFWLVLFTVVLFLPVYDKFSYFRRFAVQISTHEGLYGSGADKVLDPRMFIGNLMMIMKENTGFVIIFLLSLGSVITMMFRPASRKKHSLAFGVLSGFIAVALLSAIIVAKHYKNYYMIPALSISGFALYLVWIISRDNRFSKLITTLLYSAGGLFVLLTLWIIVPGLEARVDRRIQEQRTVDFIRRTVTEKDYLLVEPTWMAGPTPVNGLVYGISYVGNRHYFYNEYEDVYPNVLTYEGADKPMKYFRILDADNESVIKSGKDIYLLSTPGRNAALACHYLDSCAASYGLGMNCDTVYSNGVTNDRLLKLTNSGGWITAQEIRCGFEEYRNNILYSDDGKHAFQGAYTRTRDPDRLGAYSLELGKNIPESPVFKLSGVLEGDLITLTIKRKREGDAHAGMLAAGYEDMDGEEHMHLKQESLSAVSPEWELVRLQFTVAGQPADSTVTCSYRYGGEGKTILDDLVITHMTNKEFLMVFPSGPN